MEVTVINKTDFHYAVDTWLRSRPAIKQTARTLEEVLSLDLPVCEFIPINLQIESTIYEREVIASLRNHIMWAQTSRVQDCLEFEIAYESNPMLQKYRSQFEEMRELMRHQQKNGVRQDDYRLLLPMMSKTRYCVAMNYRSVMKLAAYFKDQAYHVHHLGPQFLKFSELLYKAVDDQLRKHFFRVNDFKKNFKPYKILNEKHITTPDGSTKADGVIINTGALPLHLRAQLVRHRGIQVSDELYRLFHNESAFTATLSDSIRVTVYGTETDFEEVLSKRSCWIAQYNIWKGFLSGIEKHMDTERMLPCAKGSCPFDTDAQARYQGKDPNPPCPIHCRLSKNHPSIDQKQAMWKMIDDDGRDRTFWGNQILKLSK